MKKIMLPLLISGLVLTACSANKEEAAPLAAEPAAVAAPEPAKNLAPAETTAPATTAGTTPLADSPATPAASAGFDISAVPVATPTLGAWPYVGLLDGYEKLTVKNGPGDSAREYMRDVAFDHYEFFDGTKLIPVEGRRITYKVIGKGASFFQVKKNYESVIKGWGGVTVFEGKGQALKDHSLKFEEGGHRARYWLEKDEMGVYVLRTPDKEIWVETYKPYPLDNEDYWLTVVEKKALEVTLKAIPAAELKKSLDANGHVVLYINFDTNKSVIKDESKPIIAEIVKLLEADPELKLTVEGHTDNVGTAPANQKLSEARANSVVGALIGQGIAYDRLQPKGLGQTKPLTENTTEEGRAKNRRVELVKR